MNSLKNTLTAAILIAAVLAFFTAAAANAAEKSVKKNETKAAREKNGDEKSAKATITADEIIPDETVETDETTGSDGADEKAADDKSSKNKNGPVGHNDKAIGGKAPIKSGNGSGFSFNYNAESRIDKMSRERMKSKTFLEKISNEFFKIYADEDDFTVIAEFPFGKDNTSYSYKFKDPFQLILTFTHKSDKSQKPVRYEITFPEPTKKEAFDFTVREKLELNVPIDFFYLERKNFR